MEERSDINIRAIVRFGLGLLVVAIVIHLAMAGLFYHFKKAEEREDRAAGRLPAPVAGTLPPEPRLQVDPRSEYRDYRAGEQAKLTTYGWVDRQAGIARIPIERAMELTLERGLKPKEPPK